MNRIQRIQYLTSFAQKFFPKIWKILSSWISRNRDYPGLSCQPFQMIERIALQRGLMKESGRVSDMSVARKKPRCRSPSSLAKLAQCQGASRAHLLQRGRGACRMWARSGVRLRGHLSSTFHHQRRVAGRVRTDRTRADFHGAFFFRGRVRRVPLFPVNTAEISESGVKGKRKKRGTRGQRADFPWKWKASATPFTAIPSLRRFTFLLSFCHTSSEPSFNPFRFEHLISHRRNLYFNDNLFSY